MTAWGALLVCSQVFAATAQPHRVAVIVGANAGVEGRPQLHFAYKDARRMADVLREAGGFAAGDIHVLEDPHPQQLLTVIDRLLTQLKAEPAETLFLFYYSGHSDQRAVYPAGETLPLEALRIRLDGVSATVRVGIIDACRGGAWTRAKGLSPAAPFRIDPPFALSSEGSVLISSSSGVESAHESDQLEGSFFTHHLVAGLRGAADASGDGEVSLNEAFGYAQQLTIRDSAMQAEVPQHPSFDRNLHGRTDLALTRVSATSSIVSVMQEQGPMEVVELQTGLVVLELEEGARMVRLALPPGKYVFRRRDSEGIHAREVVVAANTSVSIDEVNLTLVGNPTLPAKGTELVGSGAETTLKAHRMELRLLTGVAPDPYDQPSTLRLDTVWGGQLSLGFAWGLTDRLEVGPLSVGYRFGNLGSFEVVPYAGLSSFGYRSDPLSRGELSFTASGGLGTRFWLEPTHGLNATVGIRYLSNHAVKGSVPDLPSANVTFGYSVLVTDRVRINLGVAYEQVLPIALFFATAPARLDRKVCLGSVQSIGLRRLPLVGVQVRDGLWLEAHAMAVFHIDGGLAGEVLAGLSATF